MTTDPVQIALSIRQPWVELILPGHKTIEVRSWPTRHRGPLWLHAGMARENGFLR
ncbi:ASCH domain-containing protein [Desulfonatronum thioautotrophicum]|uniref:ASCH domain-containing protein n=1 Tax=Desulfonatronum thioautotrophicum TaxID=617001 RepID=UPI0009FCF653|nr:ASCH domain-containing protein [Desulfonatronum thioautotrophicum]